MKTIEKLYNHYQNCLQCELSAGRQSVVFGNGNPNADLLILKPHPTYLEDETGSYLTSDLKFLVKCYKKAISYRGTIENAGFNLLENAFISSAVLCRPTYTEGELEGEDRELKPKELKGCRTRLYRLIYAVDPLIIVALGTNTIKALEQIKGVQTNTRLTGTMTEMFPIKVPGVYGDVNYSVIPAPDPILAEMSGDYDYAEGKIQSLVRGLQNAVTQIKILRKEDL